MYVGIDPGKRGAIVRIAGNGRIRSWVIPLLKSGDVDLVELCNILGELSAKTVVLEQVHAIYKTSKGSTFTMGRVLGNIEAALMCNGLDFHFVRPVDWQVRVWSPKDVVKFPNGGNDTKASSAKAANRLYPKFDKKYGSNEERKRGRERSIDHDGIVDALLMAHYAKHFI